ncbi:hypothetical protein KSC_030060 [Ktedonobacter sp. SOSP1-52]|uniref:hypothetical protein n=1 Tax=Ktedonobacter sp. SOSP1-52 TaxID=2778366 RepID=UPI001A1C376E|nr:hypothetical protein [Ktedonobacter sp. SOSP1-52]GHO64114.1 hypothetical protein KSC_030060 [Ktedonobacter sp. SOSP1-52]
MLVTASAPAALCLTADQEVIAAATGSICYVDIAVQDKDGVLVTYGEPEVSVEVDGAGSLLAVGTGNPISEELYVGNHRQAYQGHLLAVVRSNGQPGEIILTACVDGLPEARISLLAQ